MRLLKLKNGLAALALAVLINLCAGNVWALSSPFAAIEVIAPVGKTIDAKAAVKIGGNFGLQASSFYTWKNHLVVYGKLTRINLLRHQLETAYPKTEVKVYQNPFYDFDRAQRCKTGVVKEWDNILLTANLVADPKMQKEYLNYHATQFQKWPEVSQGFCNAQFQQLLVFRNGRQLMLIISIPKGGDLDKLNPLTSKNNPRVDEWNKLMGKYQEGIPGTAKGESWVFLKPVK
ncbi:uncharacterized protein DUF718 [Mucilaginibacter yixingensis]|uniref:Uncharacterized protein DUF718 n=1 Tax=Mucilaginibacter yixingensis TaxID=1295612 RepID=A0A2T5J8L6_9SPHI|nr:L-rhamnose mutarotase [Mucilaginibacter yixingensis]PTQ95734.1 uncharacterized protein DUF718 [Mucilaginibacter yixingensis]